MFSAIPRRVRVSPATVIASLALVFAMTGGAYAAGKYVITSTKQIKPGVLKQLQGKAGANGAQGSAGAAGSQGSVGPAGSQGPAGPKGETGAQGSQGPKGERGEKGEEAKGGGYPETLPSEKTLKGEWSATGYVAAEAEGVQGSVSYALPLAEAPAPHYIRPGVGDPAGCSGNFEKPEAAPGNLCVFAVTEENSL